MFSTLVLLSLLFFGIGFILTERNAKYLLAGYNTMSEEQRKNLDLPSFIRFFRKFHIVLAISFFAFGWILHETGNLVAMSVFIGSYPILAYIYCIWKSAQFWKGSPRKASRVGVVVLAIVLVGVVILLALGMKNDRMELTDNGIEIEGVYSVSLPFSTIKNIELVREIPEIKVKTNGFAMGGIRKGYFLLKNDGPAKLILNTDEIPVIKLTTKEGNSIYYGLNPPENQQLFEEISERLNP